MTSLSGSTQVFELESHLFGNQAAESDTNVCKLQYDMWGDERAEGGRVLPESLFAVEVAVTCLTHADSVRDGATDADQPYGQREDLDQEDTGQGRKTEREREREDARAPTSTVVAVQVRLAVFVSLAAGALSQHESRE
jgi:hypothetical protein